MKCTLGLWYNICFMKNDVIVVQGEVLENLPNTLFKIQLDEEFKNKIIICYLSGKMRKNYIKILPGDRVRAEVTKYDPARGRIVYRL